MERDALDYNDDVLYSYMSIEIEFQWNCRNSRIAICTEAAAISFSHSPSCCSFMQTVEKCEKLATQSSSQNEFSIREREEKFAEIHSFICSSLPLFFSAQTMRRKFILHAVCVSRGEIAQIYEHLNMTEKSKNGKVLCWKKVLLGHVFGIPPNDRVWERKYTILT